MLTLKEAILIVSVFIIAILIGSFFNSDITGNLARQKRTMRQVGGMTLLNGWTCEEGYMNCGGGSKHYGVCCPAGTIVDCYCDYYNQIPKCNCF